jgi:hypothetical protein
MAEPELEIRQMSSITIEKAGRRFYLIGNTFAIKDELRSAGAKWDADRKAWWTSKFDVAERFAAGVQGTSGATGATGGTGSTGATGAERPAPGDDAIIAARVTYQGKTYYAAGNVNRGRTRYDDTVSAVTTRDGSKSLLYFRDGSKSFWAPRSAVQTVKTYSRPTTIAKLRAYAEKAKESGVGSLPDGYYVRGGEVLASGCSDCSRLGRMCRSCQHDYE